MKLTGHHVFITGGASGIGLSLSEGFLARGNKVTICGRNPEKLGQAKSCLPDLNILQADISTAKGIQKIKDELPSRLHDISVLVNNAAIGTAYSLLHEDNAGKKIEKELATNLLAPIQLCNTFLPGLMAQESAAIVNISSGFAIWPCAVVPGYSISKAGLRAFSQVLRNQLRGSRIMVFEVLPPMVDTELVKDSESVKISPKKVAEATFAGMRHDKNDICIGEVKLMGFCAGLFPRLLDWVLRRYPVKLAELDKLYPPPEDQR